VSVDPRLVAAVKEQLARRPRGATRVGWKVGAGKHERIGDGLVVGNLTSATLLSPGATYFSGGAELHVDAEVAVEVGRGYAAALEIVDLSGGDDAEEIVAANVFHRAVAFAPTQPALPDEIEASVAVNGNLERTRHAEFAPDERVREIADILAAAGERLEDGDRVITGSIVQVWVRAGDDVVADLGGLGTVKLSIA
jgi:hypothetical protein